MNPWLLFILFVIGLGYLLELIVTSLNIKSLSPALPDEFKDSFNETEYKKSQEYTRIRSRFGLMETTITTAILLVFLLLGGFNHLDILARGFGFGSIITGLIYTGLFLLLSSILSLPFTIYSTFVIEEKFGFNRTTVKTFLTDLIKMILLTVAIGAPLLALVLWFFEWAGEMAWIYCWVGVVLFSIVLQLLAPVLILPLFNKFTPLEESSLKEKIGRYASEQNFTMQGIFTMDGSKRSSKANAFFTGFGRFRKIVFFDNLIEKLSENEIVAVLAHEMGHYKLRHIQKMIVASIIQTGIMFFLLSLFIENKGMFDAFSMEHLSIYASLFFFGFLYSPISLMISILFNIFSRNNEFQADSFAAKTTGTPDHLISGLKNLSLANLSNLTPHPLYVFLYYSHPPLLERIRTLRNLHT